MRTEETSQVPVPSSSLAPGPAPGTRPSWLTVAVSSIALLTALTFGATWLSYPVEVPLSAAQTAARLAAFQKAGKLSLPVVKPELRAEALQATKMPVADQEAMLQQVQRDKNELITLVLWDDRDQDGDIVDVDSDGFRQTVQLTNAPITLAIPRPKGGVVNVHGIYDGGGGITVAIQTTDGPVAMPVMAVGQVLGIPVR